MHSREVSRALARAEAGKPVDVSEVAALLAARGDELQRLTAVARRVRDAGLEEIGRTGVVTYSRKVFIPLTRLCRDRCHYCTFVTVPAKVAAPFLSPDEVVAIAREGAALGCKEALFTLGDRPEDRWLEARTWLEEAGYDSTLEYVRAMAVRVLEETGLLPHLNPGVMSWAEMSRLRPVAPSMGMMLETTSRRLHEVRGLAHHGSPDKDPAVRLRVLEDAGRLNVPFTTGLLVGIGEDLTERAETLFALRRVHRAYGSIQEVIVQNFRAKPDTAMRHRDDLGLEEYLATVATTRVVLGPKVRLQAPPNLVDLAECRALLDAGVDDFGGISPLTPDHVNPERPWPQIDELGALCREVGFALVERLTSHPPYLSEPWLDPRLLPHVDALRGVDGLARPDAVPRGLPWQEPDGGWEDAGRTDLHMSIDSTGRTTDRRSDFEDVYGSWDLLRERVDRDRDRRPSTEALDGDLRAALRSAERDPRGLSDADALALMTAREGDALEAVCSLADDLRREAVGDDVTYVVNRNINFTNVCYTGCRFCAFAQRRTDADAFTLSLDEIGKRAVEAVEVGATEVCMQGGIHPDLPGTAYFDIAAKVNEVAPSLHVHAFSPMEVMNGVARTGLSVRDFLVRAKEAGVDSLPGTAAEILDDDVRWILTKGKLPTAQWVEVVTTAHAIGIPTTSTMMYGHVDHPGHWVAHLRTLARIMLHGLVDNIQCSWVKLGPDVCTQVLDGGVNDLGGTLMEETISRMAGSSNGSSKSVTELHEMAAKAGRRAAQRDTSYRRIAPA